DRDLRQRWYLRYPVLLGQLSFLRFRLGKLRTHKAVDRLCHSMRRRFLRSVNWTVSYSKVFAVRSADSCWQYAVASLLARADLVVFELSGPSANVRWELEECVRRGIVARVAFLAQDAYRADAMGLLAEYGIPDDSLLCYRDARDPFVEEALFSTAAQK